MQASLAARGSFLSGAKVASVARPQLRAAPVAPARAVVVDVQAGMGGKLKTRKAASKRLKVTGTGKVMARHAGKQHLNEKMSRKQIRESGKTFTVSKTDIHNITACMPYSGVNGR